MQCRLCSRSLVDDKNVMSLTCPHWPFTALTFRHDLYWVPALYLMKGWAMLNVRPRTIPLPRDRVFPCVLLFFRACWPAALIYIHTFKMTAHRFGCNLPLVLVLVCRLFSNCMQLKSFFACLFFTFFFFFCIHGWISERERNHIYTYMSLHNVYWVYYVYINRYAFK